MRHCVTLTSLEIQCYKAVIVKSSIYIQQICLMNTCFNLFLMQCLDEHLHNQMLHVQALQRRKIRFFTTPCEHSSLFWIMSKVILLYYSDVLVQTLNHVYEVSYYKAVAVLAYRLCSWVCVWGLTFPQPVPKICFLPPTSRRFVNKLVCTDNMNRHTYMRVDNLGSLHGQ